MIPKHVHAIIWYRLFSAADTIFWSNRLASPWFTQHIFLSQGFLSRTLTIHRTGEKVRVPSLLRSTTFSRSQTLRHLCAALHLR